MKKTIALIAALTVSPVMAADASPYSVEFGFGYGVAQGKLYPSKYPGDPTTKVGLGMLDATLVYTHDAHHSFNLRLGYGKGTNLFDMSKDFVGGMKSVVRLHTLMPGYRFTGGITNNLSSFCGINLGLAQLSDTVTWTLMEGKMRSRYSEAGLAYSLEAGFSYKFSKRVSGFVAGQYTATTARPTVGEDKILQQSYIALRMGLKVAF